MSRARQPTSGACRLISDGLIRPLSGMTPAQGNIVARRRQNLVSGGGPTLKNIPGVLVVLECNFCDRREAFERKALVEQFGATACLAKLRRRLAMGCDRMASPDGDRCRTKFSGLAP